MSVDFSKYEHAIRIRINYKSGRSEEAWFLKFEYDGYSWKAIFAEAKMRALNIGFENIESIWQIDFKKFVASEFGWDDKGEPIIN